MIRIHGRAVIYGELWFGEPPPQTPLGVDVLVYRYHPQALSNARTAQLHSLRSDLTGPPATLTAAFDETCRRHIRRAEREDGLRHEVFDAGGLDEFVVFYDRFARQKGLWLADRHWLERAAAARQLALSCVSRDGERLVWHAHLRAADTAQLAHSASLYRSLTPERRSLVARANRWLHWRDMLDFQALGARYYDWGGMFEDESTPERAGINHFKRTFGGTPLLAYECTVPVTLRGRVWLRLRDVLRRRARQRPAAQAA